MFQSRDELEDWKLVLKRITDFMLALGIDTFFIKKN